MNRMAFRPNSAAPPPGRAAIKLSVLLQAFNHEQWIERSLKSVLDQRLPFDWELIVADDCSTDGTRAILERYAAAHPHRIRLVLPPANLGGNGMPLYVLATELVRGEYLAYLDADDYWTCRDKLARQVALLDADSEATMCFHNADNLYPDGSRVDYLEAFGVQKKPYYEVGDLIESNFIPTSSIVVRAGAVATLPSSIFEVPSPDHIYNVLYARAGRLAYLDVTCSVRRVHPGGMISMVQSGEISLRRIATLMAMSELLTAEHRPAVEHRMDRHLMDAVRHLLREGRLDAAAGQARTIVREGRDRRLSLRERVRIRLIAWRAPVATSFVRAALSRLRHRARPLT